MADIIEKANNAYLKAVGELPYELTQKQAEAVTTCLDNAVSCITGGAGTGKTITPGHKHVHLLVDHAIG